MPSLKGWCGMFFVFILSNCIQALCQPYRVNTCMMHKCSKSLARAALMHDHWGTSKNYAAFKGLKKVSAIYKSICLPRNVDSYSLQLATSQRTQLTSKLINSNTVALYSTGCHSLGFSADSGKIPSSNCNKSTWFSKKMIHLQGQRGNCCTMTRGPLT